LPVAWPTGKISGLRARGGYEVGIEWNNGKLIAATIKNLNGDGPVKVRYGSQRVELNVKPGATKTLNAELQ